MIWIMFYAGDVAFDFQIMETFTEYMRGFEQVYAGRRS